MHDREVTNPDERSLPAGDGSLYLGQTRRTGTVKLVQQIFKHCLLEFLLPEGLAGSGELTQQTGYSGTEMTSRAHKVLTNC